MVHPSETYTILGTDFILFKILVRDGFEWLSQLGSCLSRNLRPAILHQKV